ncbi:MAG: inositol monophosphatase family protein [Myxococcota bacterium]
MDLRETFLEWAGLAARQAGHVALHLQGRVENLGKAADGTPEAEAMSAVDLATQEVILEVLRARLPHVAVDAEEDTLLARSSPAEEVGRALVVVDSVDGSFNYLNGSNDWAVMLGLIEDGRFTAAHLEFPTSARAVRAARGKGCWRRSPEGDWSRVDGFGPLPQTVLGPARLVDHVRGALEANGFQISPSRCSAIDATAPILGRGCGSIAWGVDRRHALGLFASLEAGAHVLFGGQEWMGEDPATLGTHGRPVLLATRRPDIEMWRSALQRSPTSD